MVTHPSTNRDRLNLLIRNALWLDGDIQSLYDGPYVRIVAAPSSPHPLSCFEVRWPVTVSFYFSACIAAILVLVASTSNLFKQINLLKLRDINILQTAQFIYKYHHCLLPTVFHDHCALSSNVHDHYTRSSARNKYHLPGIKSNIR